MKSDKWLRIAKYFLILFLIFLASPLVILIIKEIVSVSYEPSIPKPPTPGTVPAPGAPAPAPPMRDDIIILLVQALGAFVTAVGTVTSLLIAWRLDYRQARTLALNERETVLKEKELTLKIAELEQKLAGLKPNGGAGQASPPQDFSA